ncbi:MAG: type IV secretion system protein [Thermodesulfobacteriota bacterium]
MGTEIILVVLDSLDKYFMLIFGSFMASFGGFARAFVLLYLLLMGIGYLKAKFGEHTKEIGWSILLIIALHVFVMELAVYKEWFVDPIKRITMHMASFFVNAGMGGSDGLEGLFTRLDDAFVKMETTVDAIFPTGNLIMFASDYIKATLALGAMTLAFGAVYVAYVITLCMGFFSMYVLFVVGGICIFFGAFKQTRHVTWSWCRAVANYALLVIFASMIMGICVDGISHAMDKLAANSDPSLGYFTREIGYVICWSLLSLGLLLKSADYAAALSGGMAGSTAMITGGLAMTGGAMFSASKLAYNNPFTRGAANKVGGWIKEGASRAYSKMKGIKRSSGE